MRHHKGSAAAAAVGTNLDAANLDAAKASLFGGGGGGGGKPARRQQAADAADNANRSALFAGSKKPADWCAE